MAGRLVEDEERRPSDQRARERDPLSLSGRQLTAVVADLRPVPVGELLNDIVRGGERDGLGDLVVARGRPVRDVVPHGSTEQDGILEQDADLSAQRADVELVVGDAVDEQHAAVRAIEAEHQRHEGALTHPVRALEGDALAGLDRQGHVAEHGHGSVAECHVSGGERAAERDRPGAGVGLSLVKGQQPLKAGERLAPEEHLGHEHDGHGRLAPHEREDGEERQQVADREVVRYHRQAAEDQDEHPRDGRRGALQCRLSLGEPGHMSAIGRQLLDLRRARPQLGVLGHMCANGRDRPEVPQHPRAEPVGARLEPPNQALHSLPQHPAEHEQNGDHRQQHDHEAEVDEDE